MRFRPVVALPSGSGVCDATRGGGDEGGLEGGMSESENIADELRTGLDDALGD